MKNLKLYHNNSNLSTLTDFAAFNEIRITKDGLTIENWFEYNRDVIFNQLSQSQKQSIAKSKKKKISDLTPSDLNKNMTLPCPCYLFIDAKYVTYNLAVKHTTLQEQTSSVIALEDKKISSIINDNTENVKGAKKNKPGCRVVGWFKTMYYSKKKNNNKKVDNIYDSSQVFTDISPFISSIHTSVNESGGTFSITVPHIPVYGDINSLQSNSDMSLRGIIQSGTGNINSKDSYGSSFVNSQQFDKLKSGKTFYIKSDLNSFDYFNWLVQPNDLLFISFNDMKELVDDNLANNSFDMIALVDEVLVSKNSYGQYTVNISGRDLMKLITEDSSLYFAYGSSAGRKAVFNNTETVLRSGDLFSVQTINGKAINNAERLPNGYLNIFEQEPNDFSIDFVLKTVISKLANMQIVPDDVFTSWGDERTKFSQLNAKK